MNNTYATFGPQRCTKCGKTHYVGDCPPPAQPTPMGLVTIKRAKPRKLLEVIDISPRSPDMSDEREEIARLIDPPFWAALDDTLQWLASQGGKYEAGWPRFRFLKRELAHVMELYDRADAILARDEGRRAVVGGDWVLVPRAADADMEAAAYAGVKPYHDFGDTYWRTHMPKDLFRLAWNFMLAAAPSPPVAGETDKGSSQGSGQRGCGSRDEPAVGATATLAKGNE